MQLHRLAFLSAASGLIALLSIACGDDTTTGGGGAGGGGGQQGGAPGDGGAGGAGGGGADGGGGGAATCLPDDVLDTLNEFLLAFEGSAGALAGHPGPAEATGFFLSPGLPAPPAVPAVFAGPLVMQCSDPSEFEPFCEDGRCLQLECTGRGAGWIYHFSLEDSPTEAGAFSFETVDIDHAWLDGATGTSFAMIVSATEGARDWSMEASGALDVESALIDAVFPALLGVEARLSWSTDGSIYDGHLVVSDVAVASTRDTARLERTGACP